MAAPAQTGGLALTWTYTRAALAYWLSVFPILRREREHWRGRAETIPDPVLRAFALEAHLRKRGNVEGSAAFAAFAPPPHRRAVIRAQVAFQTIYDYTDMLAEQPSDQPIRNGWQLHQALRVALGSGEHAPDYYMSQEHREDGGYLEELARTCHAALRELPSYRAIAAPATARSENIARLQSLNLTESQGGQRELQRWAESRTPPASDLRWWEIAAAEGGSLGIFALITAAAEDGLTLERVHSIERAYWPWVNAVHTLLDSVADEAEDTKAGQRSLLDHYLSPAEAADRLQMLADEALSQIRALPNPREHAVVLAGMAGNYLSEPLCSERARFLADTALARIRLARMSVLVFKARKTADHLPQLAAAAERVAAAIRSCG